VETGLAVPEEWELYDMESDRTELHDLAASQSERIKAMVAMYEAWMDRIGVQPWPVPETPPAERIGKRAVPPYLERFNHADATQ
jgi:hypothetical protein